MSKPPRQTVPSVGSRRPIIIADCRGLARAVSADEAEELAALDR
jgi:hypothetical protein